MIAYIKGTIEHMGEDFIIIDNNGMGYEVYMPLNDISRIKLHESIKINTYQHFKEDGTTLYGFLDGESQKLFTILLNVSGVGPKAALSMLSSISPANITMAIITNDDKALSKAQGIGKKLAQRIILELKDKFKNYDFGVSKESAGDEDSGFEALGALLGLGYTRQEALNALSKIDTAMDIEEVIKQALKYLMKG